MNLIKRLLHPKKTLIAVKAKKIRKNSSLSDEDFLKKMFKVRVGYDLDLINPKTFNEKLQWLKLYDRNPIYTKMVDKHEAKEYVANIIGEKYVAKELGVWDNVNEQIFDLLPNEFVMKTTHGCGGMLICRDKTKINFIEESKKLNAGLKINYFDRSREWPYKNVKPRIIAEELLKNKDEDVLTVYKFFCFNGEPFILQVIKNDKTSKERIDYFDMEWNFLDLRQNFKNCRHHPTKPCTFSEMKDICIKLSKGIPFVRCDLYEVNGKIYFSEFTFFSDAGFERFHPSTWDKLLGDKIVLPKINRQSDD